MILICAIICVFCVNSVVTWDSEQLEVFDVVDEVKENFYSLMNISQSATNQEIKLAFRALTLKLHPDKNLDVDTSVQFRNLVSVYEVLRSATKRKYYDEVLVNGLPNWHSAVYYYRYVRKMGMVEVCIILFVIITIGQYLVNWASYLERKYTIEQNKKIKRKKSEKDKSSEPAVLLEKPSIVDTLPIQIPRLLWHVIVSLPSTLGLIKTVVAQQIEEATRPVTPEPEEPPIRVKTVRKRKGFILPEGPNFETTSHSTNNDNSDSSVVPSISSGGLWTDDDLTDLIKLVKKYPGGTTGRWEVIAANMGRSVSEVTYMANKMKENCYKSPNEQEEEQVEVKVKQKTKKEGDCVNDAMKKWSQVQQRALEDALAKYPKGCAERWDKIAEYVPNKTKEECVMRFKHIAETVKKQKEAPDQPQD